MSSRTVRESGVFALPRTNTTPAASSRLRGDEDDDDFHAPSAGYNRPSDADADWDNDYEEMAKQGYYDRDDGVRRDFGHAPSPAQARVMTKLVERYFAAAAKEDGTSACALLLPSFAASLPEDYGSVTVKTCAEVLSAAFRAERPALSAPIKVTGVRVAGVQGLALLGSTTMSARSIYLARTDGKWRIEGLVGTPLP